MSKHTKGPWEIRGGKFAPVKLASESKMYVIQTADDEGYNIGFACSWLDDPETLKEAEANARLIAAAPDLLEALEVVRDSGFESDGSGWGVIHITHEDWGQIKAAIAKARGEA